MTQSIGCYLRTHFWDDHVDRAFRLLTAAWGGPVKILANTTNHFDVPHKDLAITHTVSDLERLGLLMYPDHETALWYNSDYPIYLLGLKEAYDYFVICEYDLVVQQLDLQELAQKIALAGIDFVTPSVRVPSPSWHWTSAQKNWLEAEYGPNDIKIYASFFPLTFVSKRAARHLFSRRIAMSDLVRSGRISQHWPICESFAPTELKRAGFKIKALSDFASFEVDLSWNRARTWAETEVGTARMYHPVLAGDRLAAKLMDFAKNTVSQDPREICDWLKDQLSRPMDDGDRTAIRKLIAANEPGQP